MPQSLETLLSQLLDAGLLTPAEAQHWRAHSAADEATVAKQAIDELLAAGRLTTFQVQELTAGRGRLLHLGDYTLDERLGTGAMGQVFRARHRKMNRTVAVKILQPALARSVDMVARFHREVQAAARLSHPNIVAALDASEHDGTHFLVMEYVEGIDLARLLKADGPLEVAQAVDYILQAARGLEHAHAEGIIHRDIKPGNLLVDRRNVVKLLDLGAARMGNSWGEPIDDDDDGLTHTGSILGTVDYMAPEQALNLRHSDARSDIYSLGCTLYRLLTNQRLFPGETVLERMLGHRELPAPRLGDVLPGVPESLTAVFARMVAKRPEDRYPSMSDVVHDLEQVALDPEVFACGSDGGEISDAPEHDLADAAETVWTQTPSAHAHEDDLDADEPVADSLSSDSSHSGSSHSDVSQHEVEPSWEPVSAAVAVVEERRTPVAIAERASAPDPKVLPKPLPQPSWLLPVVGVCLLLPLLFVPMLSGSSPVAKKRQVKLSDVERIRQQEGWAPDPPYSERSLERLRQSLSTDAAQWAAAQEQLQQSWQQQLDDLATSGAQLLDREPAVEPHQLNVPLAPNAEK